ncbi:MAG: helix-turn-helix domain-containing protein [Nitrosomonas sp.]|nr:helix-turn-helix domain-containing protein [Nitrosomonas sp.]
MADAIGIPENLVSRYAYGGKGIGETMKEKICDRLGLPPTWLDETDEERPEVKYYKTDNKKKQAIIEMVLALESEEDADYASYTLRLVTKKD